MQYAQPQQQYAQPQQPQYAQPQQQYAQPQWQPTPPKQQGMPSLAYIASGVAQPQTQQQLPYKARGVSQQPPVSPGRRVEALATPTKFVMPSPEELGVATNPNQPKQPAAIPAPIDWNALHGRMERLGVLEFKKERVPTGGVRVTLYLPTGDPKLAQPVVAVAPLEADAVAAAVQYAEAWMQRR